MKYGKNGIWTMSLGTLGLIFGSAMAEARSPSSFDPTAALRKQAREQIRRGDVRKEAPPAHLAEARRDEARIQEHRQETEEFFARIAARNPGVLPAYLASSPIPAANVPREVTFRGSPGKEADSKRVRR